MVIEFKNLEDHEFYSLFLELVNNAVKHDDRKISEMEKKMLSMFMSLPPKYDHKRFSRVAKKKIKEWAANEEWTLTGLNINNKIYSLVRKGFLRRDEDGVIYLNDKLEHLIRMLRTAREKDTGVIPLTFKFLWGKQ